MKKGTSINILAIAILMFVFTTSLTAQSTKLTGGTVLLSYTNGNKNLPGSPYGYETWDFSEGKNVLLMLNLPFFRQANKVC